MFADDGGVVTIGATMRSIIDEWLSKLRRKRRAQPVYSDDNGLLMVRPSVIIDDYHRRACIETCTGRAPAVAGVHLRLGKG